jgi:hypothetical protein
VTNYVTLAIFMRKVLTAGEDEVLRAIKSIQTEGKSI